MAAETQGGGGTHPRAAASTEDDDAARFKAELAKLRQGLGECKTVHDYLVLTDKVHQIARAAAAACRRKSAPPKQPGGAGAAPAAAAGGAGSAPAAPGDAPSGAGLAAVSLLSLLPQPDDGVSCLLVRLAKPWSAARTQAYLERFAAGAKPASVDKVAGEAHALVRFELPEHRAQFAEAVSRASDPSQPAHGAPQFLLKLPGDAAPAQQPGGAAAAGAKRGAAGGAGAQQRPAKQPRTDIRDAVCPLWEVPYAEQLRTKLNTVQGALRSLAGKVGQSYGRGERPAWLEAALSGPSKAAAPLPGIVRSPQLDGYRNKAEFTLGFDAAERPTAGFLMGLYVDGVTQVADPSQCRHMSGTSLALAAATTAFLRSTANELPVWDKRHNKGFWRLLVVREGRDQTFLPLPAPPAVEEGQGGEPQAPGVLGPCAMADLPMERWLVRAPGAPEGTGGIQLSEVTEAEPPAPPPSEVLVMVQVDPTSARPEQMDQQLRTLGAALRAAAAERGLRLAALLVQHHSGPANAAPPGARLEPFPAAEGASASGSGGEGEGAGAAAFRDCLCEVQFRVSPTAFYQINAGAACLLYHAVGRMAGVGPDTLLLDVCCGTGTIGITLAKQAAHVIGVDSVESAVADARANAELNGISNATFVAAPAEAVLEGLLQEHAPKYARVVAVVDPPRAGLHRTVLRALLACAAVKRLVFVSCNPDALALNAGLLCSKYQPGGQQPAGKGPGRGGRQHRSVEPLPPMAPYVPFRPTQALAFDLFPHTKHVESVVLFERE